MMENDNNNKTTLETTRNKKHQENVIPLTITETPLPQLITSSDPVPAPTNPQLESLAIPTPPQIVPQPHITESTTNETTVNYPNQEQTITGTHGFKHHSLLTTEPPSESSPTPFNVHMAIADPHREHDDQDQPPPNVKPINWNQMSASAKRRWRQIQKHKVLSSLDP